VVVSVVVVVVVSLVVSELLLPLAPIVALLPELLVSEELLGVLVLLLGVLVLLLGVLLVELPALPVAAPAPGVALGVEPEVLGLVPEVCASARPPMASVAAAASVVRVFLVVIISNSLNGNPEGISWKKLALMPAASQITFPPESPKVVHSRQRL